MPYIVVCDQMFGLGRRYYRGAGDEKYYTKNRAFAKRYKTYEGAVDRANKITRLGAYERCYVARA